MSLQATAHIHAAHQERRTTRYALAGSGYGSGVRFGFGAKVATPQVRLKGEQKWPKSPPPVRRFWWTMRSTTSVPAGVALSSRSAVGNLIIQLCRTLRTGISRMKTRIRSTTILCVRRDGKVVAGGRRQVTLGSEVLKGSAKKLRRLYNEKIVAGFAGSTADAFSLFGRFEAKLEQFNGNLSRSAGRVGERLAHGPDAAASGCVAVGRDPTNTLSSAATAT